jgi:hypothetical protein
VEEIEKLAQRPVIQSCLTKKNNEVDAEPNAPLGGLGGLVHMQLVRFVGAIPARRINARRISITATAACQCLERPPWRWMVRERPWKKKQQEKQ